MQQSIPKIVHQTWKETKVPRHLQAFQQTWRTQHPDWAYRLWTDADNRALIREHYAWFLPIYDNYPEPIMRVDAARYFILFHHGGLYIDLDFECLRPVDSLLADKQFVIGLEPTEHLERVMPQERHLKHILCNAFIASVPRHPFWPHLFKQLVGRHLEPHPLDATGPFLLTEAYGSFGQQESMSVESANRLYPLSERQLWQENNKRRKSCPIPDEAYAVHHWQGTWWRKERGWIKQNKQKLLDLSKKTASNLSARWKYTLPQKRDTLNEHLQPHKVRLYQPLINTYQPLPLSGVAEDSNQIWFAVLHGGQPIARAVLDQAQCERFLKQANNLPRVSAMMVTKGRPQLAQRAIRCFQKQTYPNKELVIIDDDPDETLFDWVSNLLARPGKKPNILYVRLPAENKSLGELRNIAVERATGAYVAQWDDDDLSHPKRLALQMALLQLFQTDACFLQREQIWMPERQQLALSSRWMWESSMVCAKAKMGLYPPLRKGEDTPVTSQIALQGRVLLLDYPQLYTYVFHGNNTFDYEHFEKHWKDATAHYVGGAYDVMVQQLQSDVQLDLSAWRYKATSQYDPPLQPYTATSRKPRHTPHQSFPKVLILTPVKDAERFLAHYIHNLNTLTYPHERLSLAFLESDSQDGTYEWLTTHLPELEAEFGSAKLFKQDFAYQTDLPRWAPSQQRRRRATMAKSRNMLLAHALTDEEWVLWIDVDLLRYPPDVIEELLAARKKIVVPHCILEDGRTFDLNTFKFKPEAEQWDWSPFILDGILQPPLGHGRYYLSDLRHYQSVEVDGVGGTMLLVQADVHREGLVFPTFPYKYHIETEGLAYMAKDMGYTCWGLPHLEIVHR